VNSIYNFSRYRHFLLLRQRDVHVLVRSNQRTKVEITNMTV
jgi:hypothetical protein